MQINAKALRDLLNKRGYIQISSNGISMTPIIRTRTLCRFEPIDINDLQVGDILLFVSNTGKLVGHRYLKTIFSDEGVRYICKGDSNLNADVPISANQIVGKMVSLQYSRFRIRTDSVWLKLWGKMIINFPAVSVCIHYGLRLREMPRG